MRSNRLLPVSMVCVAAALPGLALADAGSLSVSGNRAPITEVTLYPGIAAVQREARIDAQTRLLVEHFFPGAFACVHGHRQGIPLKPDPAPVIRTVRFMPPPPAGPAWPGWSTVMAIAGCWRQPR